MLSRIDNGIRPVEFSSTALPWGRPHGQHPSYLCATVTRMTRYRVNTEGLEPKNCSLIVERACLSQDSLGARDNSLPESISLAVVEGLADSDRYVHPSENLPSPVERRTRLVTQTRERNNSLPKAGQAN
jgi:hypothetical protein